MIKFIGIAHKDNESLLYFTEAKNGIYQLNVIKSNDGYEFSGERMQAVVVDHNQEEEKRFNWKNVRIAKQGDQYFLTYKLESDRDQRLYGAVSKDLLHWEKTGPVASIKETGTVISDYQYRNQNFMYFGEKSVHAAYSAYLYQWTSLKSILLKSRKKSFDEGELEVGNAFVLDEYIFLTYYTRKIENDLAKYCVGAALFDKKEPTELVWRSEEPLWVQPEDFYNEDIVPFGSTIRNGELILYWLVNGHTIFAVSCPLPNRATAIKDKNFQTLFKKADENPIISPDPSHPWESRATFNSAALYEDGKVHFLYRALGDTDLSVLGYATSKDGIHIDDRSDEPVYFPREPFETPGGHAFKKFADHFASGGGYGGIEDPRITRVEDKVYLTYVAFDGATPPRSAMSSIDIEDFLNKRWDKWQSPKLISAPGMVNKSAVVFPKKVKGKYVVFHRVYPNILVDYLDDLEFDDYLQGHYFIPPRKKFWDSKKVGAGAPPMETKDGWLLIYQSVGYQDSGRYKIGAMMLDKNNPEKVLYRTHSPIIEPNEGYENNGFKAGVVYPCGAVIMDNKLHVYYGGADTVVCAASTDLDKFLYEMKHHQEPKLRKVTTVGLN